ncbi:4Fe-4S dicluster domain-containing protein [Leptolyngbya sp. FACHB-671]|uniref:(Fe-S)-binding protein n=1 Tax=Leptolyngbya sp. FACHB-671 TaxID=2692812 RepID=UPI00168506BA|nr:heterodisulfide reductase-related iron-sulfur binding cluster [Leptolyngbya sp. FACHB-671]MBD2069604.1 4Fe-4S dicluster domain-containing protein [Leptolyngbya sp. FACHB-671]
MNTSDPTKPADQFNQNLDNQNLDSFPSFDAKHPPDQKLVDACVHCGFCLTTCPSYRVLGKEMDSPRGRIYLMNAINHHEAPLSTATSQHFDSCLGCLACTTACPSGVQYDQLIAATRPQVERNVPRSLGDRLFRQLIFSLFPYPNRLRWLLVPLFVYQKLGLPKLVRSTGLLQRFLPRLAAMESLLPNVTAESFQDTLPTVIPAQGEQRYRVGMILGCVQRLFFSEVNEATARVLSANGCEVVIPKSQGCCAALPQHQGQEEQAQAIARQMIDSFEGTDVDAIIINAAGCGHTLKEYGHILQDDPDYREKAHEFASKVKDVQEFLGAIGLTAKLSPLTDAPLTLVYQDACHLLHGQKISLQPRQLLRQIPNVQLREPIDAALCCGSAGVYNMLQPEVADELGQQKVQNLLNTGATLIASSNPGCSLQIQKHLQLQGKTVPLMHPIRLLDYSIRGVKLEQL